MRSDHLLSRAHILCLKVSNPLKGSMDRMNCRDSRINHGLDYRHHKMKILIGLGLRNVNVLA